MFDSKMAKLAKSAYSQTVVGGSLRVKHVAVQEPEDVRELQEELPDVDVVNPWVKKWSWNDVHLAQTANTEVTCRVCLGTKYVYHADSIGIECLTLCPECKGTKRMISF